MKARYLFPISRVVIAILAPITSFLSAWVGLDLMTVAGFFAFFAAVLPRGTNRFYLFSLMAIAVLGLGSIASHIATMDAPFRDPESWPYTVAYPLGVIVILTELLGLFRGSRKGNHHGSAL